jgi:hypothetical protein
MDWNATSPRTARPARRQLSKPATSVAEIPGKGEPDQRAPPFLHRPELRRVQGQLKKAIGPEVDRKPQPI